MFPFTRVAQLDVPFRQGYSGRCSPSPLTRVSQVDVFPHQGYQGRCSPSSRLARQMSALTKVTQEDVPHQVRVTQVNVNHHQDYSDRFSSSTGDYSCRCPPSLGLISQMLYFTRAVSRQISPLTSVAQIDVPPRQGKPGRCSPHQGCSYRCSASPRLFKQMFLLPPSQGYSVRCSPSTGLLSQMFLLQQGQSGRCSH